MPRRSPRVLRHRPGVLVTPGRFVFQLPYTEPPLVANKKLHWRPHADETKALQQAVRVLARGLDPIRTPCTIGLVWHVGDRRRRDDENISPSRKPLIDGLVLAGLLPDDSSEFVVRPWSQIVQSGGWGLELHVEEA